MLSRLFGPSRAEVEVPSELAVDGREFEIRSDGKDLTARVTLKPFYDPDGEALRS